MRAETELRSPSSSPCPLLLGYRNQRHCGRGTEHLLRAKPCARRRGSFVETWASLPYFTGVQGALAVMGGGPSGIFLPRVWSGEAGTRGQRCPWLRQGGNDFHNADKEGGGGRGGDPHGLRTGPPPQSLYRPVKWTLGPIAQAGKLRRGDGDELALGYPAISRQSQDANSVLCPPHICAFSAALPLSSIHSSACVPWVS